MNDSPTEELFQALLSGSLTAPEEEALEEHLASCVRCEERLRQLTSDSTAERWRGLVHKPEAPGPGPGAGASGLLDTPRTGAGEAPGTGPWTPGRKRE